jgi:hypothetical protein
MGKFYLKFDHINIFFYKFLYILSNIMSLPSYDLFALELEEYAEYENIMEKIDEI